jgi:Zn-dependent protease
MDLADWISSRAIFMIPLLLSLSVHEWAHAFCALRLGDDTATQLGRTSVNPLAHIDPVGTLLLPLLGIPFGWAKPVPVNPVRFREDIRMGMGMLLVAIAGPLSNVCLAGLSIALLAGLVRLPIADATQLAAGHSFLEQMVLLNGVLALFNLLPIPPLDGSRIVDNFMPRNLRPAWDRFAAVAPLALLAVLFLPQLAGFSLLEKPIGWMRSLIGLVGG